MQSANDPIYTRAGLAARSPAHSPSIKRVVCNQLKINYTICEFVQNMRAEGLVYQPTWHPCKANLQCPFYPLSLRTGSPGGAAAASRPSPEGARVAQRESRVCLTWLVNHFLQLLVGHALAELLRNTLQVLERNPASLILRVAIQDFCVIIFKYSVLDLLQRPARAPSSTPVCSSSIGRLSPAVSLPNL